MKHRITFTLGVALLVAAVAAQAGTPLTCFSFNIGDAKSLPWAGTADRQNWHAPDPKYDTKRLAEDTLALLGPDTPVIVRMETIRRAAVYARQDESAGRELLARIRARAESQPNAMFVFDYGYLVETYKQIDTKIKALTAGADGYSSVTKAIQLRGGDPQMEFAASLISSWPKKDSQESHFQKAVAGAAKDPLLANNLLSYYSNRGATLAQLRASKN